jgi:hypothetical protein
MRHHAVFCVFFADAAIESYADQPFADAATVFPSQFTPGLNLLWDKLERRKIPWINATADLSKAKSNAITRSSWPTMVGVEFYQTRRAAIGAKSHR